MQLSTCIFGALMPFAFINGNIYASFKPLKNVEALVIDDKSGRIIYMGSSEGARRVVETLGGEVIDLSGKTVLPGFVDSHAHLDQLGMELNMLDFHGVKSIEELKQRLLEYSKGAETLWIMGFGWDQELFKEKRFLTRWDLDEVVSKRPAMLVRVCMHVAVLNSRAIEITGVESLNSPNVLRDARGVATGVVREEVLEYVRKKIAESLSVEDYEKYIMDAAKHMVSQGVTTVGFVGCSVNALKALAKLWSEKKLPIRVRVYLDGAASWDAIEALEKIGVRTGFGDEFLKIMGVRVHADGSLGARTAWLSKPYADDPATSGRPDIDFRDLKALVRKVHESGLQMAVHGIGDRAIDMILSVYRDAGNVKEARHRIEHASVLREDQVSELAKLGVAVSIHPQFITSDWWAKERLGSERLKWLYPIKTLVKSGVAIGFGSDSPVEAPNPWFSIYSAVTRGVLDGVPHAKETESECISVLEALHIHTYGSAYILHEEANLGTLEVGKLADFIVVNRDPLAVEPKELKNIRVLETYIGGKRVWP